MHRSTTVCTQDQYFHKDHDAQPETAWKAAFPTAGPNPAEIHGITLMFWNVQFTKQKDSVKVLAV